jgi:hypothetical protein
MPGIPIDNMCTSFSAMGSAVVLPLKPSKGYEFEVAIFGGGTQVGNICSQGVGYAFCGVVAASCARLRTARPVYSSHVAVTSLACCYLQRLKTDMVCAAVTLRRPPSNMTALQHCLVAIHEHSLLVWIFCAAEQGHHVPLKLCS